MKKPGRAWIAVLCLVAFLTGCGGNYLDFTDETLVTYTEAEAFGLNEHIEIMIDNSGQGVYRQVRYVGYEEQEVSAEAAFSLSETEITSLQAEIARVNFMHLREDLTDPYVLDGSSQHITVYADGTSRTCGGYNPSNRRFKRLRSVILSFVPDGTAKECHEKFEAALAATFPVSDSDH